LPGSRDLKSNGIEKQVENFHDSGVKLVEQSHLGAFKGVVGSKRLADSTGQGSVDFFKELEEDDAEAIAIRG